MPFIYTLIDPRDNRVRYVGKSNNPKCRYWSHINDYSGANPRKQHWIKKLRKIGLGPILHIIEMCSDDEWQEREKYWITKYRKIYPDLLNISDGGDCTCFSDEARIKYIRKQAGKFGIELKKCAICHEDTIAYSGICKKCLKEIAQNSDPEWLRFFLKDYKREKDSYRIINKYECAISEDKLDEILKFHSYYNLPVIRL